MLSSLIHAEAGSSSQYRLVAFEPYRLLQPLFGYHYLTSSLMEPSRPCGRTKGVGEAISVPGQALSPVRLPRSHKNVR